jgi:hypothetical protein
VPAIGEVSTDVGDGSGRGLDNCNAGDVTGGAVGHCAVADLANHAARNLRSIPMGRLSNARPRDPCRPKRRLGYADCPRSPSAPCRKVMAVPGPIGRHRYLGILDAGQVLDDLLASMVHMSMRYKKRVRFIAISLCPSPPRPPASPQAASGFSNLSRVQKKVCSRVTSDGGHTCHGRGTFGTARWWALSQPKQSRFMSTRCRRPDLMCAARGAVITCGRPPSIEDNGRRVISKPRT